MRRSQALYEHRHPPPLTGAINSCLYAWLPSSTTAAPNLHVSVAIHSHGKVVHLSRAVPHSNRRLVARPHPCIVMRACTLTYMHTCIRTHIQAYIHTCMHAHTRPPPCIGVCTVSVSTPAGRYHTQLRCPNTGSLWPQTKPPDTYSRHVPRVRHPAVIQQQPRAHPRRRSVHRLVHRVA